MPKYTLKSANINGKPITKVGSISKALKNLEINPNPFANGRAYIIYKPLKSTPTNQEILDKMAAEFTTNNIVSKPQRVQTTGHFPHKKVPIFAKKLTKSK